MSTTGILRNVPRGTTEKWRFVSGGASHPVHMHLVDFKITSRERVDINKSLGRTSIAPYEAAAIKDVVLLGPNEAVTVSARYAVSLCLPSTELVLYINLYSLGMEYTCSIATMYFMKIMKWLVSPQNYRLI